MLYIKTRNSIIEELRYKHDVQASIKKDNPNDLTIYTNALNSSVAINLTNERHKLKMYDTFGNLVEVRQFTRLYNYRKRQSFERNLHYAYYFGKL